MSDKPLNDTPKARLLAVDIWTDGETQDRVSELKAIARSALSKEAAKRYPLLQPAEREFVQIADGASVLTIEWAY